ANLLAQTDVALSIPNQIATGTESTICTPIIADTFRAITAGQFSVTWDDQVLDFQEIRLGNNPLNLDETGTSMPGPDNFRVNYVTSDGNGLTLTPGTVLLEFCYATRVTSGTSSLSFSGQFAPEFAREGSFDPIPFDTIPGSITFGPDVAVSVLPGDTDGNNQVDHRDLLNIGILHGTTGPERPEVAADFTPQLAPVWPGLLAGGNNHAQVDADGNGVINNDDLIIVNQNYALEADGGFEFAPTVSTPAGPSLTLTTEAPLDAGQQGTIIVSLGDGATPDAVGYGLAFTLSFDPSKIELNSVVADFSNSFLGDDLLTIATFNSRATGIMEVAMSRKDQLNATVPGGELMRFTFTTIPATDNGDFTTEIGVFPNAFWRADQTQAPINSSMTTFDVMGSSSLIIAGADNPIEVYPNPTASRTYFKNLPTAAPLMVSVYNRWGQRLIHKSFNGQDLDLRGLPPGLYILEITDGVQRWINNISVTGQE
ncbi:MAG: T9SS type A sorting domain-containing protein, partial [Bacteroidota bacterium]